MAVFQEQPNGRHDAMKRRRTWRKGRERGVYLYVPAEDLAAAGFDPHGDAPYYRTWGYRRGSVVVRLYRAP